VFCHTEGVFAMPDDAIHAVGNELCALPGCHPQADDITPTTTPTTTTPTTTEPTTTEPTTTEPTTTGPTTTEPTTTEPTTTEPAVAPPLTSAGHDAYLLLGLCNMCHDPVTGGGPNYYPVEGPNDHTGRTDDICATQEGCHVLGEIVG
jgi:hypothetical protein